jgi:hypothetical protein
MEFSTNGREPFMVGTRPKSERLVTVEKTKDFYFWGISPEKPEFNLQDETSDAGISGPSGISIEQSYTFTDVLYTVITFGLYCPVTYTITLLDKGELN